MPASGTGGTARVLRIAGGVCVLAALACYRPNIRDGGFLCNLDAGAQPCPEGFTCDDKTSQPPFLCWRGAHDAGEVVDRVVVDVPPDVPDTGVDADSGSPSCFDARPDCDPSDAGACDPFCQTGCNGCRDKCTVTAGDGGAGQFMCVAVPANAIPLLGICDTARDNCAPGLVCMDDNCGGRCYQYCRADGDCPSSTCSRTAPGGQMACDVPSVDCVPTARSAGGQTGCPTMSLACFISFSHPDHTLCDCPGGASEMMPCTGSGSCLAGLLCVDPGSLGSKQCLRVCGLQDPSSCPFGTCRQFFGSSTTNTPNPTFGFCF